MNSNLLYVVLLITLLCINNRIFAEKDPYADRCGPDYGKCKEGYCCSEYLHCGKSEAHCKKGCYSFYSGEGSACQYDSRCGVGLYAKCMNNECCSKHGWCGTTDEYCKKSKGCQDFYGRCED